MYRENAGIYHAPTEIRSSQAVSRWLATAAARVRARVWSNGICGGESGAGTGFLRVLRFPLPIFIPPNSPFSQSPGASTIGQLNGRRAEWTQFGLHPPLCELKRITCRFKKYTTKLVPIVHLLLKRSYDSRINGL
jgi:hypothetical protein